MLKQSFFESCIEHACFRIILLLIALPSLAFAQAPTSALSVPLLLPSAIVFDSSGNLYLAETANHVIRKVDSLGNLTTIAGTGTQGFSGDNGPATAASLDSPQGLALDSFGNLYIADTHNHRIRKLNLATGIIVTIAGTGTPGFLGDGGPATAARMDLPTALALDTGGNLYFADTQNNRIRRIDATRGSVTTVAGSGRQGLSGDNGQAISAGIDSPTGLAVDASSLYLADTHNHRIRRIDLASGLITTLAGTGAGDFSGDFGSAGSAALSLPHGLTLDSSGNLFFADTQNHRIRRIDATTGVISTVAGSGVQGFSGDNGSAIAATLDSPKTAALSSSGLVTLADTGNQRIRQLDAASTTQIRTIAGFSASLAPSLTLSAPSIIPYGSGQVVATLDNTGSATGNIVFRNDANVIATVSLQNNSATLNTATLPVGTYRLAALYTGDQTHLPAQTPAFALSITPQPLSATITSPLTLVYGQAVPPLSGSISGVLPQDAGNVAVAFHTDATAFSSAGSYPIAASLSGTAAGNYTLAGPFGTLAIEPASSSITLGNLVGSADSGSALNFTIQVAGTSAGVPAGTVTLVDGANPIATATLSASGVAAFSGIILSPGSHTLTAIYNGSKNFAPSISAVQQINITVGTTPPPATADFALAATGATSQTIASGSSASFGFTVAPQGSLSSAVTLTAAGLPSFATASFNPPTVVPGAASTVVTLTIATAPTTAGRETLSPLWALLAFPFLGLTLVSRGCACRIKLLALTVGCFVLLSATGCGNRTNASGSSSSSASKSYTITITGTATNPSGATVQHVAGITLIVQAPG